MEERKFLKPDACRAASIDSHDMFPVQAADGVEPPPIGTLVAEEGYLSPDGKEMETLEGKLARWMVKNQVISAVCIPRQPFKRFCFCGSSQ